MILVLPKEKVLNIQNKGTQLLTVPQSTIMELTKLLGKLSSPAQTVFPGRV